MLGIIYLIFCFWIGLEAIKRFLPGIYDISRLGHFAGRSALSPWVVCMPSAFLTGSVFCAWFTYLAACLFSRTREPLLWANLCFFGVSILLISLILIGERKSPPPQKFFNFTAAYRHSFFEIIFFAGLLIFWGWFLFETLYIDGGKVFTGGSVYGDFGVHLGFIRSFSWGSNFPAEHPHFGGVPMHKHFLFQFLAGNLNYLGFPIDWSYNLPSLLSFVAFIMLLYSLAVLITGERAVGALAAIMVLCRSSFAFLTFIKDVDISDNFFQSIFSYSNLIGNTRYDNWGIWTPNVHLNQRHFSFCLGILVMVVIALLPLARQMVLAVRKRREGPAKPYMSTLMSEFMLRKDAWLPERYGYAVFLGMLLGLSGFFNSAVVLGAVLIMLGMAVFSKQRLTHFIIIALTGVLMSAAARFITGSGSSPVAILFKPGFLAPEPEFMSIVKYYIELLGILPFVIMAGLFVAIPGTRRLLVAFLLPLTFVNFIQLSIKPHDGHKMAQVSFYLINIFAALFIVRLFKGQLGILTYFKNKSLMVTRVKAWKFFPKLRYLAAGLRIIVVLVLVFFLTVSGWIDLIVLYNRQQGTYGYDPVMTHWIARHTDPHGLFLSMPYVAHPVLLAGRRLFLGRPYYVKFLGYDTDQRQEIAEQIFSGGDVKTIKALLSENKIKYIVIDRGLRRSKDYTLNEEFFKQNFSLIYQRSGIDIYEVN